METTNKINGEDFVKCTCRNLLDVENCTKNCGHNSEHEPTTNKSAQNKNNLEICENHTNPIEYCRCRINELFHIWRKSETDSTLIEMDGQDLAKIIYKARTDTFKKFPEMRKFSASQNQQLTDQLKEAVQLIKEKDAWLDKLVEENEILKQSNSYYKSIIAETNIQHAAEIERLKQQLNKQNKSFNSNNSNR